MARDRRHISALAAQARRWQALCRRRGLPLAVEPSSEKPATLTMAPEVLGTRGWVGGAEGRGRSALGARVSCTLGRGREIGGHVDLADLPFLLLWL